MTFTATELQPLQHKPFNRGEFDRLLEAEYQRIVNACFLRPEWADPKNKLSMVINVLPTILSFAALLYPGLILDTGRSAYHWLRAIVSFVVNYPQFFIPIAIVLSEPLHYYKGYLHKLMRDRSFRSTQPDASLMLALVRDLLSIPIGYFTAGLWPSVAKSVSWLNNDAFELIVVPAAICLQVVGTRHFLDAAFTGIPPFGDRMLVGSYRRQITESFLRHLDRLRTMELALSVGDRATDIDSLLTRGDRIGAFPLWNKGTQIFLWALAFHWFAISNLGYAKSLALDHELSMFKRIASIVVGTYGFGVFGALTFASFAPYVLAVCLSKGLMLKHNLSKIILALACVGICYLTALPSELAFERFFSPASNNTHTVNLPEHAFNVLRPVVEMGAIYGNSLWLILFAVPLLEKTAFFRDDFSLRMEIFKKVFAALEPVEQMQYIQSLCAQNPALGAQIQKDLPRLFKHHGCSIEELLGALSRSHQDAAVRAMVDIHAKSRQWSMFVIALMSGAISAVPLCFFDIWYLSFTGPVVAELVGGSVDCCLERTKQPAVSISPDSGLGSVNSPREDGEDIEAAGNEHAFFPPVSTSKTDQAIAVIKIVVAAALPLAVYSGTQALATWVARTVFETDEQTAKETGETWAKAMTTGASFVATMWRLGR